ncbi:MULTISPECIES: hypothetical protein [Streptomyces]|uniref:hypothetical protein n=1 Tax=Streptomyces TaxID=1883 RepID=UPI001488C0DC|nr:MULTISPECIES: hypothetical protein [Streptomyces]
MARAQVLSKPAVGIAAVGLSLAIIVGAAPAALANSFGKSYNDVSFGYDDGGDRFCVTPADGYGAHVMLAPNAADRGPAYNEELPKGSGGRCFSLATAYEDSGYNYAVGTGKNWYAGTFYS